MNAFKLSLIAVLVLTAASGCRSTAQPQDPIPVLMICEHGSVKSVMAATLFNKAATQRRLPYRAIARGVSPDASVPPAIAAALARDGFDVAHFVPSATSAAEVERAARVIVIGLTPEAVAGRASAPVDAWLDVPAASVDYAAASASLQRHVDALLDELERDRAP
jgi:arsenate reductase